MNYIQAWKPGKMHWVRQSKVSSSKNIPTFINTYVYILERVAHKICIHLSQFSETEALCSKNISIMSASGADLGEGVGGAPPPLRWPAAF